MRSPARYIHSVLSLGFVISQLFTPQHSQAETPDYEVFVTADRYPTEWRDLSTANSVIEGEQIEELRAGDPAQVLSLVPGLDIVRSGTRGGNTSLFLRGANPEHTLVLFDGIKLNNPISNGKFFNFSDFTLDNIDRIEVVRGPQSVLYGSEAIGGVIQFLSKVPEKPFEASTRLEVGNYDQVNVSGSIAGRSNFVNYSTSISHSESSGVSAASRRYGNTEDDGIRYNGFSGKLQLTPDEDSRFTLYSRVSRSTSDLDQFGGAYGDDPNRYLVNENVFVRGEAKTSYLSGAWKPEFSVAYADHSLEDNNDPDAGSPLVLRSNYEGSSLQMNFLNHLLLTPTTSGVLGFEREIETGSSEYLIYDPTFTYSEDLAPRTSENGSAFVNVKQQVGEWITPNIGARYDHHQGFGDHLSWQSGVSFVLEPQISKISANYGTGFKAPSLFQRFSIYGNEDLEPEISRGVDLSVERYFSELDTTFRYTYFNNQFKDLISFDPNSYKFYGVGEARTEGSEISMTWEPTTTFSVEAVYTYLSTWDEEAKDQLLRRAPHRASLSPRLRLSDYVTVRALIKYVGEREDNDFSTFPATRTTLNDYVTTDLITDYKVANGTNLYLRLENLFDKEYEDVLGYGTQGTTILLGINKNFGGE